MIVPRKLYQRILKLCRHRHAGIYFMTLAFLEAFILPLSPAIMQVPLTLARPKRAWRYCLLGVIGSVIGGMIGYAIGDFFIRFFIPLFQELGWEAAFLQMQGWFSNYGLIVLFLAGLSPTPYKITTIAAGAVGISFLPFVIISLLARSLHFSIMAYVLSSSHAKKVKRFMATRYVKRVRK